MKACVLHAPAPVRQRPLRWTEVDTPSPGPGELLVKVAACGVCRTDLHVVEGELEPRRSPVIPGHQVVGEVVGLGDGVQAPGVGQRVGIAWLHRTCGACRYCNTGRENLCETPQFTGWTVDGGFAQYAVAPAAFVYPLPDDAHELRAAPLLCAGIIGYRSMRLTGLGDDWTGVRLGIYGFGAAGHVVIQLARARGADVYVCTRDAARHQSLATELGATWVGGTVDAPPVALDAAIVFAPAGEIVPAALQALDKGGTLVLGGIHMSPIPQLQYRWLYGERCVRTVTNNTREDGHAFLAEAARAGVVTTAQAYPMSEANEALIALKHDAIRGAAVLVND